MIIEDFEHLDDWVMYTYKYVGETKDKVIIFDNYKTLTLEFRTKLGNIFMKKMGGSNQKSYYVGKYKFSSYILTPERKQKLVEIINRQLLPFI